MADLILKDLRDLFGKNLVQFLSIEKRKMLGGQSLPAKKTTANRFKITDSFNKVKKDRPAPRTVRWFDGEEERNDENCNPNG
jgi:hypothetical protein